MDLLRVHGVIQTSVVRKTINADIFVKKLFMCISIRKINVISEYCNFRSYVSVFKNISTKYTLLVYKKGGTS